MKTNNLLIAYFWVADEVKFMLNIKQGIRRNIKINERPKLWSLPYNWTNMVESQYHNPPISITKWNCKWNVTCPETSPLHMGIAVFTILNFWDISRIYGGEVNRAHWLNIHPNKDGNFYRFGGYTVYPNFNGPV